MSKMLKYKLLWCVVLVVLGCIGNIHGKVCSDCLTYTSCPNALELAVNDRKESTKTLFLEAFCGYGYDFLKWMKIPKVCCSDFNVALQTGAGGLETKAVKNRIESHPNRRLLPDNCGDINGERIFGGSVAKIHEFPWMVLISYYTGEGLRFLCSGSIINSKYILTAGHCVDGSKQIAGVRIGEFDIRYKTDCQGEEPNIVCESHIQDIGVEKKIIHEDYSRLTKAPLNDIALLRLRKTINFSYRNAYPICLPISQDLLNYELGDRVGTVAGWGITEIFAKYSPVLLKVNVTIMSSEECVNEYNRNYELNENKETLHYLCAGGVKKDSCTGDSGSPLMLEGEYMGIIRNVQYGIVSHGPKCGSGPAGFYTDVTKNMEWILEKIEE